MKFGLWTFHKQKIFDMVALFNVFGKLGSLKLLRVQYRVVNIRSTAKFIIGFEGEAITSLFQTHGPYRRDHRHKSTKMVSHTVAHYRIGFAHDHGRPQGGGNGHLTPPPGN